MKFNKNNYIDFVAIGSTIAKYRKIINFEWHERFTTVPLKLCPIKMELSFHVFL